MLTTDWSSAGLSAQPGLRFDLRYDQIDQKILYFGTHRLDRATIPIPNAREIEQRTVNNYVTASFDYSRSADWGVTVSLPYVGRGHTTISPGDTAVSTSRTSDLGDVRIVGRFQGFPTKSVVGVQFGVKLPTGGYGDTFYRGPQAGQPLDRGLQAGTGTTDLMRACIISARCPRNSATSFARPPTSLSITATSISPASSSIARRGCAIWVGGA